MDMLSLIVVLPEEIMAAFMPAFGASADVPGVFPPEHQLNTSVSVLSTANSELECAWIQGRTVHRAILLRLICSSDSWHARKAMESQRLNMRLSISMPGLTGSADFTTEAISALQASARVSVCLDLQYMDFVSKRDFDEWAFALELVGVDRIYVSDQLTYRSRSASQEARGFVVPTHDFPHRYVLPPGRDAPQPTTYRMEEQSDQAVSYLCLHDHWYDDWVGVAWSPDEYLSFEGLGVPSPKVRTNLASEAIRAFTDVRMKATDASPVWPFCMAEICMNRPFYSPSKQLAGEATQWTLPVEGVKLQYSGGGMLALERFTKRYQSLPTPSANRKCFFHPDWRLGTMKVKKHGFPLSSCPPRLQTSAQPGSGGECTLGRHPALRRPCLELCGTWANRTCETCQSTPSPGCGASYEAAHYHTTAYGEIIGGVDLAHFRIAPSENQPAGFRHTLWLSNLSSTVRPLVEQAASEFA